MDNVVYIKLEGVINDEYRGEFQVSEFSPTLYQVTALTEGKAKRKPTNIIKGSTFYINRVDVTQMH